MIELWLHLKVSIRIPRRTLLVTFLGDNFCIQNFKVKIKRLHKCRKEGKSKLQLDPIICINFFSLNFVAWTAGCKVGSVVELNYGAKYSLQKRLQI
jgi:hypothetical protein